MDIIERLKEGVPVKVERWAGNDGEDRIPMIGEASDTMREAAKVVEDLRSRLSRIAAHTSPYDTENYRSDDREGCLDTVYAISSSSQSN